MHKNNLWLLHKPQPSLPAQGNVAIFDELCIAGLQLIWLECTAHAERHVNEGEKAPKQVEVSTSSMQYDVHPKVACT